MTQTTTEGIPITAVFDLDGMYHGPYILSVIDDKTIDQLHIYRDNSYRRLVTSRVPLSKQVKSVKECETR